MFKSLRVAWSLLTLAALGVWAAAQGPNEQAFRSTQRIITFDAAVPPAERAAIVKQQGGIIVHELPLINAVAADFPQRAFALDSGLQALPGVKKTEVDFRQKWIESAAAPAEWSLPSVSDIVAPFKSDRQAREPEAKKGKAIPWGVTRVNAPAAWSTTMGDGVKVGVIDTGIDFNHPQLKANIKGGWNALQGADANNFMDDHGHGTHVSGTIGAVKNGKGVVGVAPHVELYGIKVLDANGSGTFSDVIAGIDWAAAHKMDVVNMSLGGPEGSDALQASVDAATKAGVTIIAAAGNSGPDPNTVGYPGAYPQVIAIAAMDDQNKIADFSSRGPQVAFTAPGVNIYSTYKGGAYQTMSGTSMACPHMVGLAALAMAAKHIHGTDAVRAAFQAAATSLDGPSPSDQGAGVVDALKLVQ